MNFNISLQISPKQKSQNLIKKWYNLEIDLSNLKLIIYNFNLGPFKNAEVLYSRDNQNSSIKAIKSELPRDVKISNLVIKV